MAPPFGKGLASDNRHLVTIHGDFDDGEHVVDGWAERIVDERLQQSKRAALGGVCHPLLKPVPASIAKEGGAKAIQIVRILAIHDAKSKDGPGVDLIS